MASVTSVTLNKDGTATTGASDTLIGTAEEHVREITARLVAFFDHDLEAATKAAEAIVADHIVKPVEALIDHVEPDAPAPVTTPADKPAAKGAAAPPAAPAAADTSAE